MPRDGVILSDLPVRLGELVSAVRATGTPLAVQGVDRLNTAAVLTEEGELVCAVHEPALLESDAQIERLRPDDAADQLTPCFWHDVWVGGVLPDAAHEILTALAAAAEGQLVLSPPPPPC